MSGKELYRFGEDPYLRNRVAEFLQKHPKVTACYIPDSFAGTGGYLSSPARGYRVHAYPPVPKIYLAETIVVPATNFELDSTEEGGLLEGKIVGVPLIVYRYQTDVTGFIAFLRAKH